MRVLLRPFLLPPVSSASGCLRLVEGADNSRIDAGRADTGQTKAGRTKARPYRDQRCGRDDY